MKNNGKKKLDVYLEGTKAGVPIGLGYFAVAFALGIAAKQIGITWLQGFTTSLFTYASAGQYEGFRLIGESASAGLMILMMAVINARYILMSTALSQRFSPDTPIYSRLLAGACITDEIFGVTIARDGYVQPIYMFGAFSVAVPLWAIGTMIGIIAGNILPETIVSALGVMLYGMFICVIIPPARKDRKIFAIVLISFIVSYLCTILPGIKNLSEGTRILILTIIISAAAAASFPVKEGQDE